MVLRRCLRLFSGFSKEVCGCRLRFGLAVADQVVLHDFNFWLFAIGAAVGVIMSVIIIVHTARSFKHDSI